MSIPLPSQFVVTLSKTNPNKAKIEISSLYPGYGHTIGNSLRRVLLSSLEGAGISLVKIKGVNHEFTTLPYIKEEILEIILNLRQVYLKLHTDEKEILNLEVKGKKNVTAKDFEKNPNIEIINKNHHIATLTHKNAELVIEATVEKGLGFNTVEEREQEIEVGVISIDTMFAPIKTIGYEVVDARVGKRTNYDKLILEIETNGAIDAKEAVRQASEILLQQFNFVYREAGGAIEQIEKINKPTVLKKSAKKSKKESI